jgi:6-phosphogluconolactonase (cycloisomerase 2 family)
MSESGPGDGRAEAQRDGPGDAGEAAADAVVDAGPDASGVVDGGAFDGASEIAYVATFLSGLRALRLEADGGALVETDASPYAAGAGFYAVGVDPSGQFLYAVDANSNQIYGFRVAAGGGLAPLAGFPIGTGTGPVSIAIDPLERLAYVGTSDPNASLLTYRIDPDGGGLTRTAAPAYVLHSSADFVTAAPSGLFVYVCSASGIHAYAVDADAGTLGELDASPFGAPSVYRGSLVFHPDGRLLFAGGNGLHVFHADPTTGVLDRVDGSPFTTDVGSDQESRDLAIDPTGRFVYAVGNGTDHLSAFAIGDAGSVVPLPGSPYEAGTMPYSVAVDPAARFVLVGNDDVNKLTVFAMDPQQGTLSPVAGSPFDVVGLQPEIVIVPR